MAGNAPLTASRVVVSDGSSEAASSSVTSTELGYVSGVTSAIQTQIDAIANQVTPDWQPSVRAATTAALAANTYDNGTSGVGATLTGNSNGALAAQDDITLIANEELLVKDESTGANNGIYVVTQVGDGSNPYILTRRTNFDAAADITAGATVFISEGTANGNETWQLTTDDAITVGTTALVFAQLSGGAAEVTLAGAETLTNKTIDADNNTLSNIGAAEIKADLITGQSAAAAFASGDKLLIVSGGALEQADYDDLPGAGVTVVPQSEPATGNFFIGTSAGAGLTTGDYNVGSGGSALFSVTTGTNNVSVGYQSMYSSLGADQNAAIGYQSMFSNLGANNNAAFGYQSLYSNTTGADNTAIGHLALYSNTIGDSNVAIGRGAGLNDIASAPNTSGTDNVFIGYYCESSSATSTNEIVIGYQTNGIGDNTVVLGNDSITTTALKGAAYIGNGVTNASPSATSVNATGGSGTDIAGGALTIAGGKGTGNAAGGNILFKTSTAGGSGTTLQSLATAAQIRSSDQNLELTGAIELGHASDTTIARTGAGVIAVEGVEVTTNTATQTLTNKTLTSPTLVTPAIGTPSSGVLTNTTGYPGDNAFSTGLLTGGALTTGTASTEYSISDGTGQIVDADGSYTLVSWSGESNRTPVALATHLISFVGVNSVGTIVEQTTPFTNTQRRTIIPLGVAVHVDKTTVDAVNNAQTTAFNTGAQLNDLVESIGFFNVTGNVISANGANLNLNKSAGSLYGVGVNYANDADNPNVVTLPALTALSFQYRFSNGDNGVTGTAFDPDNLDNGAGGTTALTNNKWSIQRVYSFTSNNVKIQRGVAEYATQDAAIAAISTEAFITEPSIAANGLLRGFIIAKQGATALNSLSEAIFVEASKFQSSTGGIGSAAETLQDVYDNSAANPEILTDATNGAVTIRRGSAADTDDVLEVQNNAGTKLFSVTGNGTIEIGHASDTTLARTGAGVLAIEGVEITTNSGTQTLTNKTLTSPTLTTPALGTPASGDLASCTGKTGVYRHQWIGAGAMIPRTTNGAAAATVELATNDVMLDVFDFDTATEEGVGFWTNFGDEWDAGTVKVKFYWTAASGSGTAKFDISGQSFADSDVLDQALGTEQGVEDTLITANDMHISDATAALTIADATAGEPVYLQIARDVATDTLAVDARLIGCMIQYKESTTEPSAW